MRLPRAACLVAFSLLTVLVGCGGSSGRGGTDIAVSTVSGPTGTVPSGGAVVFVHRVANLGSNPASAVDIRNIASGISVDSIVCTAEAGAVCPTPTASVMVSPLIPPGGALNFQVNGTVVRGVNGQISDTLTASYTEDTERGNNSGTITGTGYTVVSSVVVTGAGPAGTATSGGTAEFVMTVRNDGPDEALALRLVNTIGPNLQLAAISCSATGGAVCPATTSVLMDVERLPAAGALAFTVTAVVNQGINGTVQNTMEVGLDTDDNRTDNRATALATVFTPRAGVSVVGVGPATTALGGSETTFTMTVANTGPDPATNINIVNSVGSRLTLSSVSCVPAGGAVCPTVLGPVMSVPSMVVGGSLAFAVAAKVSDGSNGIVINTMQVTADNDADRSNNSATASVQTFTPRVGLSVTGVGPQGTVVGGADAVFLMTVTNAGPDPASNVSIVNNVGSGLTLSGVVCAAANGAVCPATLGPVISVPTIPVGGSLAFTVTARVASGANGTVANTMQVSADNDVDRNDNSATATAKAITPRVGVYVAGVGPTAPVSGGTEAVFVMTVGNVGPDATTDFTLVNNVGSGASLSKIVCTAASGATCPATVGPSMTVPSLPANGTLTFAVTVRLTAGANGAITNTMQATVDNDVDRTDNSATAFLQAFTGRAELSVTGTGPVDVAAGTTATFTMQVTNLGPDMAEKVRLINTVGGNLTLTAIRCTASSGSTCPAVLGPAMDVLNFPVGGLLTFQIDATVGNATQGTITNSLNARVTSGVPSETVGLGVGSAYTNNVSTTASGPTGPITPGSSVVFNTTVTNNGPGPARNVQLTHTLSSGLAASGSISCSASGGATCPTSASSSVVVALIPAGGTLTFSVPATINSGVDANVGVTVKAVAVGDFFPGDNASTATFRARP